MPAGDKERRGKHAGTMQFFQGGCRAGRLRALILEYAEKHGVSPEEAGARVLEQMAVGSERATYAAGVKHVRVFVVGHAPEGWPKKQR